MGSSMWHYFSRGIFLNNRLSKTISEDHRINTFAIVAGIVIGFGVCDIGIINHQHHRYHQHLFSDQVQLLTQSSTQFSPSPAVSPVLPMTLSLRHFQTLITAAFAVLALIATVSPNANPTANQPSMNHQPLTLEMIRQAALASRGLF